MGLAPPHQPAAVLLLLRRAGRVRPRGRGPAGAGLGGAGLLAGRGPTGPQGRGGARRGAYPVCQAAGAGLEGITRILMRPERGGSRWRG